MEKMAPPDTELPDAPDIGLDGRAVRPSEDTTDAAAVEGRKVSAGKVPWHLVPLKTLAFDAG